MKAYSPHRSRPTLMPGIALATLAAVVAVPTLSATHLHADTAPRSAIMTVTAGDSLWTIAERATPDGGNVPETVDEIVATNHLSAASIVPGQRLRVPRP